jgi:NADPH:quinone reductase-like Zn-dependent oxidoreductase
MQRTQVWIEKNGPAQVMTLKESTCPPVGNQQVLIKVHFSGINFADIIMRLGFYPDAPQKPFVPGYEVSGIVEKVGRGVKGLNVGDKVCALTHFSGYSSHVVLDDNQVIKLGSDVDLEEAAAIPVTFVTAEVALNDMGRVRKGDKVLIDCATGGVGVMATQMALEAGAEVYGLTSSEKKKAFIKANGAHAFTHEEFAMDKNLNEFDFVLNSLGGESIVQHFKRLRQTGRIVCIGISSGIEGKKRNWFKILKTVVLTPRFSMLKLFNLNKGVYGLNALRILEDPQLVADIKSRLSQSQYSQTVGKVFKASDVALAHQAIENREVTGKVLLHWH